MRIHRVEMAGFGPFRDDQTVDLDRYADDGLFLLSGRTGAGKSSILDAICFAIYGSVPRYDGADRRLRSDHCEPEDETAVAVEFTASGARWRIERSPGYERPKRRGVGMTAVAARVRMGVVGRDGVDWRAAREREVGLLVAETVGLGIEQFLQVVLLAQGRFAQFLLAKNADRQALLRTLFGSHRFGDYVARLKERRDAADGEVSARSALLDATLATAERAVERLDVLLGEEEGGAPARDGFSAATDDAIADTASGRGPGAEPSGAGGLGGERAGRIAGLAAAMARAEAGAASAETEAEAAEVRRAAAVSDLERRRSDRERQLHRDELRGTLRTLDGRDAEIADARRRLAAARLADGVRSVLDAHDSALRRCAAADVVLADARRALAGSDPEPSDLDDAGALDGIAAEAQRRLGSWLPAVEIERALPDAERALLSLRDGLAVAGAAHAEAEAAILELPLRRAALDERMREAGETASRRDPAEARLAEVAQRLAAAQEVEQRVVAYRQAAEEAESARRSRDAADAQLAELHRRRLAGYAGELALGLVPGAPCPVCGALEHPAPTDADDSPATAEEIEAAEAARAEAARAEERAGDRRREAEVALTAAETRAQGATIAELTVQRAAAAAELAAAEEASREVEGLLAGRRALDEEETALAGRRAEAAAARGDLEARIRVAEAAAERDREAVAEARGGAASVAARIEHERERARAAAGLAEALRAADRATAAKDEAAGSLADALALSGFADADEARAAILTPAAQELIDTTVVEHDQQRRSARDALAVLDAAGLPEDEIDTGAALAAAEAAARDRDAVSGRLSALREALSTLVDGHARAVGIAAETAAEARRAAAVRALWEAVSGRNEKKMDLETFVLAAELEGIVEAANRRLDEMSDGRYALAHTDALAYRNAASGLGLEVIDRFTGRARPPQSLSGGETFLASLSLALGLAEVVTNRSGGITLDTLFIDEGFGSLDGETLEVAMRTLDRLREGGRTVGVISHVEAMKEQIPAQLRVERTAQGWSRVVQ